MTAAAGLLFDPAPAEPAEVLLDRPDVDVAIGVDEALFEAGIVGRSLSTLHTEWIAEVVSALDELPLDVPLRSSPIEIDAADIPDALQGDPEVNGRLGEHTEEFVEPADGGFSEC